MAILFLTSSALLFSADPAGVFAPRRVKVAYIESETNFQKNSDGTYTGYTVAYLQDIARLTGWEYEFIECALTDSFRCLEDGTIDIVPMVLYSPERAKKYAFPDYCYGSTNLTLFVGDKSKLDRSNYFNRETPVSVAVAAGTQNVTDFEYFAAQRHIPYTFVYCDSLPDVVAAVAGGKAESGVLCNYQSFAGTKPIVRFGAQPYYFVTRKNEPEILDGLNTAMKHLSFADPDHDGKLFAQYNKNGDNLVAFSPEEFAYIENIKTLRVLYTSFWEPLVVVDPQSGAVSGILPDILKTAAMNALLPVEFVSDDDKSVPTRNVFTEKNIDILGCFTGRDIFADRIGLALSESYFDVSRLQIINPELKSDSKYYAVTFLPDGGELPGVADMEPLICATAAECFEALKTGRVSKAFVNTYSAINLLSDIRYASFDSMALQGATVRIRMAFSENTDPILVSIMNKAINSVSLTEVNDIIVRNTFADRKITIAAFIRSHPISVIILICIIFGFVIIAILYATSFSRRRLEREKNQQLEAALKIAEKSSAAKSEFMSHMSHEIRTPLNAIIGYTAIALNAFDQSDRDLPCADCAKVLDSLKKSDIASTHLLSVINDVLDMSAIESGNMKIAHDRFNLKETISSLSILFSSLAENKNINLEIVMKEISDEWFTGDEMRISQILTNLLSNAVKFTPHDGCVKLIVTELNRTAESSRLCFVVSDTGIGMDAEYIQHIWEPFKQENASITRYFGGSGLGLAIAKSLVDILGGSISVESTKNIGSVFTVELNIDHDHAVETAPPEPVIFDGKRILLAEDNEMNMEITKQVLSEKGFIVDCAWNGQEAADLFLQRSESYCAVLMDVQMPGMDGLEAARVIRRSACANAESIPIFAMTADVFAENISSIYDAGMTGYIPKPFNKEKLFETLQRCCGDRQ